MTRARSLFVLGLLLTLLLPACTGPTEDLTPIYSTHVLAFHIDPQQGTLTQAQPGQASIIPTTNGQELVNDLLNPDSMNYWFSGNKLILEVVFTNVSSTSLGQPFTFVPNPATSNIVSSVEPIVSDADLGGDGVLSPGEATSVLRFEVTHRYQRFTYVVDAYAVVGDPASMVRQFGGSSIDEALGVATDASGNIYVTGYTNGDLEGNTSAGLDDGFLVKYDSAGNKIWTRQFGSSSSERALGVVADSSGGIYVAGWTNGELEGTDTSSNSDIFIIKYDSAGNRIWTRQFGSSSSNGVRNIAIDASDNIYVTGWTWGGLDGNAYAGGGDLFLMKYDSAGNRIWTRQLGTSSWEQGTNVATDASGNVYVSGYTLGGLDGNTNAGSHDLFLLKYDSAGSKIWTRQLGTSNDERAWAVATDAGGNAYVTGRTTGGLDGNSNAGSWDLFVVKYDGAGNKIWTRQLGTSNDDRTYGAATNASGGIYVTGTTTGGLDGNSNAGGVDMFLVKYDSAGNRIWTQQVGTSGSDRTLGMTADSLGSIYVAGATSGDLSGNGNTGGLDAFLVKFAP